MALPISSLWSNNAPAKYIVYSVFTSAFIIFHPSLIRIVNQPKLTLWQNVDRN